MIPEILKLLNSSLIFTNKILSSPSELFISFTFQKTFSLWSSKVNSILKILATIYNPGTKTSTIKKTEQNIFNVFISVLEKFCGIMISQDLDLFETSFNILLENMLQDIKMKNSVCPRDICVLPNALKSDYMVKSVLNKSTVFKLSSIIWLLDYSESEHFENIRNLLDVLIPSIFPDVLENEILNNQRDDKAFFHSLTLCPSVIKEDFVMLKEYNMLALQVLSTLSCSILSSCYLQAKFKLSDKLFNLQSHHGNINNELIIDPVSVIQNHLLVKLYTVGGFGERFLPPETLIEMNEDYSFPFFKSYPVPQVYYPELSVNGASDADITFELNGENLKDIFLEYVEDDLLTVDVTAQILKASINIPEPVFSLSQTLNCASLEDVDDVDLQEEII